MTVEEFQAEHGCKVPSDVTLHELIDESGKSVKGLLLKDPAKPWRHVELQRCMAMSLQRGIAQSSQMLRPQQNRDLFKMLVADDVFQESQALLEPLG